MSLRHAAMSARVHCACVTRQYAHTRRTQHPFLMYRCLRKKVPFRHYIARVVATLPPSLQCWWCEERGGMPPAKKDSLSARAYLHRHRINIEDMGGGGGNSVGARSRKGTFFRRHRNKKKNMHLQGVCIVVVRVLRQQCNSQHPVTQCLEFLF